MTNAASQIDILNMLSGPTTKRRKNRYVERTFEVTLLVISANQFVESRNGRFSNKNPTLQWRNFRAQPLYWMKIEHPGNR